jgi:hypothetical protein
MPVFVKKAATFSLGILLLGMINASCKKESKGNASRKLKTYTEDISAMGVGHLIETFNINYDDQDRITSVISTTKPGHRLEYKYSSKDQFTFERIEDNKVTLHCTYYINMGLSLIDSMFQYNNRNDTLSFKYLYNEDKQPVREKEYLHSYTIPRPVWANTVKYQYDLQGILTKKTDDNSEISYRYDAEFKNTVQLQPFYFPVQEHLPSHTYITKFGTTTTTEHTYTFDGDKRLTSEKAVSSDGRTTLKTYTYL